MRTRSTYDAGLLRALAFERARGRCEVTGRPLGESWALHHRRPRGPGGTSRTDVHKLSNVLAVTHEVHNLARPSIHLDVAWAKARGYLLNQSAIPRLVPVLLHGAWPVLLTDSGLYLRVSERPPVPQTGGRSTG